jgi:serine/threonine protein phosphatase 1
MMLKFVEQRPQPDDWLQCGGAETLASYGSKNHRKAIPSHHLDYVRTWVDCFETASHFFVHGNYNPDQQLPEQPFHLYRWISLRQSVPAAHCSGKTAIVGHTSQKDGEILEIGYLRCIDTYCHGGGWLTALDTVSGKIWQVDRDGRMRDD